MNLQGNDRPVIEALLEGGETIANIVLHDNILSEVPIIGHAIRTCKAIDSIRERAFIAKLAPFMGSLCTLSEKQKESLKEKISSSPYEARKVGETLFFVLERLTDLDKPSLLAAVFTAYIDGAISCEELQRTAQAIDVAFLTDIKQLLAIEDIQPEYMEPWAFALIASGLTRLAGSGALGDAGRLYCIISPLGAKLKEAYSYSLKNHV